MTAKRNHFLCGTCGEAEPDKFYPDKKGTCRACCIKRAAASKAKKRAENPEEFRKRAAEQAMKEYWRNPEKFIERSKEYYQNNIEDRRKYHNERYKDGGRERMQEWRENEDNRQKTNATARRWRNNNVEKAIERLNKWKKENPAKSAIYTKRRQERIQQRMPKWLNDSHIEEMNGYYFYCRLFSISENLQVDHIVPIAGKKASGLHVPWNLQILSEEENRSKSNYVPFMFTKYIEKPEIVYLDDRTCKFSFD